MVSVLPTFGRASETYYPKAAKPFNLRRWCWANRVLWAALAAVQVLTVVLVLRGDVVLDPRGRFSAAAPTDRVTVSGWLVQPRTPTVDFLLRAHDPLCVAWRATRDCKALGARDLHGDLHCFESVPPSSSGFCECALGRVASPVDCGHAGFSCKDVCARRFPGSTHVTARSRPLALWTLPACVAWRTSSSCSPIGRRVSLEVNCFMPSIPLVLCNTLCFFRPPPPSLPLTPTPAPFCCPRFFSFQ